MIFPSHPTKDLTNLLIRMSRIDCSTEADTIRQSLALKLHFFVENRLPIELILPSFPYKSPNPCRVLGAVPDKAEELSLRYLTTQIDLLGKIYPYGVRLIIASDGRVYSALQREWWCGFNDQVISRYRSGIFELLGNIPKGNLISVFSLEDYGIHTADHAALFLSNRGNTRETIVRRTKDDLDFNRVYIGMKRFRISELAASSRGEKLSRAQIKKYASIFTIDQLRLGDAWSSCMKEAFPRAIRLSVHSHFNKEKLGIRLFPDSFGTPWHHVALREKATGIFRFTRLDKGLDAGATLVKENGRPSYLEI